MTTQAHPYNARLIVAATGRSWRIAGPDGVIAAGRVEYGDKADQIEAAGQVMDQLERGAIRIRHASLRELHRSRRPSADSVPFYTFEKPRGRRRHVVVDRRTGNPVGWFSSRAKALEDIERRDPLPKAEPADSSELREVRKATRELSEILGIEAERRWMAEGGAQGLLEIVLPQVRAYVARFEGLVR